MQQDDNSVWSGPELRRHLGISAATLRVWIRDPRVGFPQPDLIVLRRLYWHAETITHWLARRRRQRRSTTSTAS